MLGCCFVRMLCRLAVSVWTQEVLICQVTVADIISENWLCSDISHDVLMVRAFLGLSFIFADDCMYNMLVQDWFVFFSFVFSGLFASMFQQLIVVFYISGSR